MLQALWYSEDPGPSSISIHTVPGSYRSSEKSWMTQLENASLNCCVSEMEKYCLRNGISFKILLIVDNSPAIPLFIVNLCPNVRVVFLSPNTTSMIQPMDQGVIAAFEAYQLRGGSLSRLLLQLRKIMRRH